MTLGAGRVLLLFVIPAILKCLHKAGVPLAVNNNPIYWFFLKFDKKIPMNYRTLISL